MEWIKISEDTHLPEGTRVLLREDYSFTVYYKAGTIEQGKVREDDIDKTNALTHYTHYCIITDPNS